MYSKNLKIQTCLGLAFPFFTRMPKLFFHCSEKNLCAWNLSFRRDLNVYQTINMETIYDIEILLNVKCPL